MSLDQGAGSERERVVHDERADARTRVRACVWRRNVRLARVRSSEVKHASVQISDSL